MSWNNLKVSDDENSEWHNGGCSVEYNATLSTDYESKICENQRLGKENKHLRKQIKLWNDVCNVEVDKNIKQKETIDKAIEYVKKNIEFCKNGGYGHLVQDEILSILENKEV